MIVEAPRWLAPGGHLLVEVSRAQAREDTEVFERSGLRTRVATDEPLEATVVIGASP